MKMTGDESRLNVCPIQFATNKPCRRARPDRVLDVRDRRHKRDKTKIVFEHGEKSADPAAIAGAEHTELLTAAFAQSCHQLPQLDYTLAQPLGVADKIGRDREFTIPVTARDT